MFITLSSHVPSFNPMQKYIDSEISKKRNTVCKLRIFRVAKNVRNKKRKKQIFCVELFLPWQNITA